MEERLHALLTAASDFLWGWPLIVLLFGTHLFLTVRLGFVQRHIGLAIRLSVARDPDGEGDVSHFGALTTALAATIGTGNIYGVAGAVLLGGPGAVLWMWLTGVFGIATKYAEALLAVKYRVKNERGEMAGGPMYVLEKALGMRWLGVLFALFTSLAAFGIGNMTQANAIAEMMAVQVPDFPKWLVGLALATATAAVILGGIRSIARVCEVLVPFMTVFYVAGCLVILLADPGGVADALGVIVTTAFTGQAALGGFVGAGIREAMRYGIARGLFSNESGLGSAPIVAAAARTDNPVRQALVSATGTFWDTVVVCALTGLVVVTSGGWTGEGLTKASLCDAAFARIGMFGTFILTGGLLTFVFSTILGWAYYGEKAVEYLLGVRAVTPYRTAWVAAVYLGAVAQMDVVWTFSDVMNGLMALPNLLALLMLSGAVAAEGRKYLPALRGGAGPPAASERRAASADR
ncbi:MAG: sodium:alanine symporter family protein [Thermodesulfobacteriota bacterium]